MRISRRMRPHIHADMAEGLTSTSVWRMEEPHRHTWVRHSLCAQEGPVEGTPMPPARTSQLVVPRAVHHHLPRTRFVCRPQLLTRIEACP
jgi:hypothetical protein